jgi:hypothetical protein
VLVQRKAWALLAFLALTALVVLLARPPRRRGALAGPSSLPIWIRTDLGPMNVELEYLPGVVDCELGWLTEERAALEAQAISARTYLARYLDDRGLDVKVPVGPHFQCWRRARHPRSREAVEDTAGAVLRVRGRLIYANYASGADQLDEGCRAPPPVTFGYAFGSWDDLRRAWLRGQRFAGYAWTEILVTDNAAVRASPGGLRRTPQSPNDAKNRGALGQHAAVCLAAQRELDAVGILKHFYGPDVEVWTGTRRLR